MYWNHIIIIFRLHCTISYSLPLLLLKLVELGSMFMRMLMKYGLKTDIIGKFIYMCYNKTEWQL